MHSLNYIKNIYLLYKQNKYEINKVNYKMLSLLYIILSIISITVFALSFFLVELNHQQLLYGVITGLILLGASFNFMFIKKHLKHIQYDVAFFEVAVFLTTIVLSSYYCVNDTGVIFLIVLLSVPLTYIKMPYISIIETLAAAALYIVFCVIFKEPDIIVLDIINTLFVTILTIFLIFTVAFKKIEGINSQRLLKNQIDIDELTKLANRRKMNKFVEKNRSVFEDVESDVAIIMLDIDFFKVYNDTYGHLQGDACLELISDVLKEINFKYNCDFVRYGGEEFACVLLNQDYKQAEIICKDIITSVYKLKIENKATQLNRITISAGVASKQRSKTKSFNQLIELADNALYIAKNNGKNCYAISSPKRDKEIETL